ncbi:SDR family NAD(P)-dependent oxidoreductase [Streptomyces rapamycinicus]|uniref:Oxidoreductase n=2 Tax=Streptomyces rapamycinicus TaxID=1226757 RepID=A0A0A0N8P2_STRRN|nr:SDR family oxidoreductase [Streptomyces rapamycinicus]AGP53119.1 oxidoreductase [Streptomyces rapamycinicus NRRL 5491]MBB4780601.1 NAD(P)-dependent dehydrogenase (short-subunit alcohol dehydrogenase family) [Streptomyces rapamycinicus]RLV74748.1 oxidoreductase [Streptomyces rapamycinicus NRRL 5491]UTO61314.1 SDR family oxidoreductase [Streptomyces rapamycinicus]UTP29261.1 SDR family oxidoreductase [Streptomyces rapamycinicus NRRL 5491]
MAESRHAVVTGVSSGIGAAIAARLLDEGWRITGLSRTAPAHAVTRLHWIPADLSRPEGLPEVLAPVSGVDAIVHAAGVQRSARLGELDPEDGSLMWRIHVQAAGVLVDTLVDRVADGGRVVLVGSRTMTGVPGKSQYAATKAALPALARSWAAELAPRAVTVNVVAPGPTDTPMLRDPGRSRTPPVMPPLGRLVRAEEVAGLTSFLLGPEGGAVTGQTLVMCAGASL